MSITVSTASGPIECSSQIHADLIEEYEVLYREATVTFSTSNGPREGKVTGYCISGAPQHLTLTISYRGGRYVRSASEIEA